MLRAIIFGLCLSLSFSAQAAQTFTGDNLNEILDDSQLVDDTYVNLGDYGVELKDAQVTFDREGRGAILQKLHKWTDGVLPLLFPKKLPRKYRDKLLNACRVWEEVANVKCVEGPYKRRGVKITTDSKMGCFALWGMGSHFLFLKRKMNLAKGCWDEATLIHEVGHALGLIHEHQRPDRDKYVKIFKKNIGKNFLGLQWKVNFAKQNAEMVTPYDFFSIMHYGRKAFSKNGRDTMLPVAKFEKYGDIIGRVDRISPEDAQTMAHLYGAP